MSHVATREVALPGLPNRRHQPEQTLLYQIIEQHYPEFREVMATQDENLAFSYTTGICRLPYND